ncbi:TetR/AcrR family transcriptional regulator [Acidihalobacter ferrooxydans]|uniref:HTH tetR-type domain-containing protein n=1 Tax=Acidihalobacter ferrooxydans TaxID=1765967 RepID=A0A1P8UIM4_9GAMM|nr:TetR/AcrR family transcriptional regulator [Acidihalobacter ferrooxydans]APZ43686.1 hypothetical protein BW247_11790 [Acidihalobacter ferrooxydans]
MQAARQRCPETTRQNLLDAAHREIYVHGFQGASLERILTDTGLSKGALYHHFTTKQALGLAVIEEVIGARLRREWIEPVARAPQPLRMLRELIEHKQQKATGLSIRLGCDLNNLMQEMSPLDETFRNALAQLIQAWRTALQDALERAQAAGEVRADADCARAALFIVAAVEGCTGVSKNQHDVTDYRACLDGVKEYLISLQA